MVLNIYIKKVLYKIKFYLDAFLKKQGAKMFAK